MAEQQKPLHAQEYRPESVCQNGFTCMYMKYADVSWKGKSPPVVEGTSKFTKNVRAYIIPEQLANTNEAIVIFFVADTYGD